MAAVGAQHLENVTKETLTKIRTDQSLANQRFQEKDALRPDWRLVLVHQAILKLLKITGSYYEAIDLIVRAIYQRVNQESFSS